MENRCPKCGKNNLYAVTEEAVAVDDIKKKRKVKYWVCANCNYKFRDLDDLKDEIYQREKVFKSGLVLMGVTFGISILCFIIHFSFFAWFCLIFAVLFGILSPLLRNRINNDWEEYKKLEQMLKNTTAKKDLAKEDDKKTESGKTKPVENDEILENLIIMANQGDVEAMVMVGDYYSNGVRTEKNDVEAHKYYKMAADKGDLDSNLAVGIDFYSGTGISKNERLAEKYLTVAADGGIACAQYILASIYELNEEIEDRKKAIKYFRMASEQGHAKSQIELARLMILSQKPRYSLEDALFWLVCAYLHNSDEKNKEDSQDALKKINVLIEGGLEGGKQKVMQVIKNIKSNYPQYLKDPF